jgi:peptidoglycan/xylan/chitin deacetylase (PgdA/CDA1 family)
MYHFTGHLMNHLQGKVLILMYHRVVSDKELGRYFIQPGMYVKHDVFEKQIQFLKQHFIILSFTDFLSLSKENKLNQKRRYCIVTFDDGWLDNYIYAYPILTKYQITATIFLATSFIGTNRWFWSDKLGYLLKHYYKIPITQGNRGLEFLHDSSIQWANHKVEIDTVIEKCKEYTENQLHEIIDGMTKTLGADVPDEPLFLTWDMVEDMSRHGISFGSHSSSHKILTRYPLDDVRKELEESKQVLMTKRVSYVPVFAYPNGNYNHQIQKMVRDCGYAAAPTTEFGFENCSSPSLLSLRRINIHNDVTTTLPLFTLHLSGLRRVLTNKMICSFSK